MKTFRTTCAKNNQKIELIVKYNSLDEAKESLHKQWYSIVEIVEVSESVIDSGVFYFEAIINGKRQNGQVKSNDIFRAYKRLVDDLHYDVVAIYDNKEAEEKEKLLVTQKVRESFEVFKSQQKTQDITNVTSESDTNSLSSSVEIPEFIQKELQKYYTLIDRLVEKIEQILTVHIQDIPTDTKETLVRLIPSLRQVKNITNLDKLKIVWEATLLKIGEVELSLVSQKATSEKKQFLSETNKLLGDFWSHKQIKPKTEDPIRKLERIVRDFYRELFQSKKAETVINKQSYAYLKTVREINIYKHKLTQINAAIFKNSLSFKTQENRKLRLKKKLIIQNITILENKVQNKKFSYTQIVKGFEYYKDIFLFLIQSLGNVILFSVFLYALFFLVFGSQASFLWKEFSFNLTSIYLVVLLSFFAFLSRVSKNLSLIGILSCLYIAFFIFVRVNLS